MAAGTLAAGVSDKPFALAPAVGHEAVADIGLGGWRAGTLLWVV